MKIATAIFDPDWVADPQNAEAREMIWKIIQTQTGYQGGVGDYVVETLAHVGVELSMQREDERGFVHQEFLVPKWARKAVDSHIPGLTQVWIQHDGAPNRLVIVQNTESHLSFSVWLREETLSQPDPVEADTAVIDHLAVATVSLAGALVSRRAFQ